jgi:uncharacterized membrane protein YkvA (DUF1232 family)
MVIGVRIALGLAAGLALAWAVLVITLIVLRPRNGMLSEALRILPDTVRLLRRLATARSLPVAVRARLWLLFAYLAMPLDLIPDFIPVIGYADDAIIIAAVLRSVVRRAGVEVVVRTWPGTADGLATISRLARLDIEDR